MRFELKTLVDITETGARRGEDSHQYNQQQNFLTLFQTISLRANPIIKKKPKVEKCNVSNLGFGKKHQGVHSVWSLTFEFESEDQHSLAFLKTDVDLVPIINNLNETADLSIGAFITQDEKDTNIIFREIDKYY
jgi:mannose/fructose/N-acetylgalactosamine-specific phosphotransferase system component IIB